MNDFTCERCGRSFCRISNLKYHYKRKKACDNIHNSSKSTSELLESTGNINRSQYTLSCCNCLKKFATDKTLQQHKDRCKVDPVSRERKELEEELKTLADQMSQTDDINDKNTLLQKINEITNRLSNNPINCSQTIGTQNNVYINNTYVVLQNFGSEDVSHVINDKEFLDSCLKSLPRGVPRVVEKIYYDPSKPENKTVLVKSAKRRTALYHQDGEWFEVDLNQIVPTMLKNGSNILSNHLVTKEVTDDNQDVHSAKQTFLMSILAKKKPEYDQVSSAVKALVCNFRQE